MSAGWQVLLVDLADRIVTNWGNTLRTLSILATFAAAYWLVR
jgi:hypothetical protein